MKSMLRKLALAVVPACAIAFGTAVPTVATASVIQLGFILDSSGSIGAGNWNTIRTGLANAVNTLVPADGTYEISVVTFSSGAVINVNHILLTDAATRQGVANTIAALPFLAGTTNYTAAFGSMLTALSGGALQTATASYVNFATDGDPNPDSANGLAERTALIAAGVDNISIEGIGTALNAANLQNNYCYPGPCDLTAPFNFPAQGFYLAVPTAADYAAAIGNKIQVITQVPEPGTLALLCIAMAGFGFARHRKAG